MRRRGATHYCANDAHEGKLGAYVKMNDKGLYNWYSDGWEWEWRSEWFTPTNSLSDLQFILDRLSTFPVVDLVKKALDAMTPENMEMVGSIEDFAERIVAAGWVPSNETIAQQADEIERLREPWVSVEDRLPEIGVLVMVYSPKQSGDYDDDIRIDFDFLDPDADEPSWCNHNEHYEHFCCVALPEGSSGPSEKAPYTHWMPLPKPPKESEHE